MLLLRLPVLLQLVLLLLRPIFLQAALKALLPQQLGNQGRGLQLQHGGEHASRGRRCRRAARAAPLSARQPGAAVPRALNARAAVAARLERPSHQPGHKRGRRGRG